MAIIQPMDILREQAEKKLCDSGVVLGQAQQGWQQANNQLEQLKTYEREYQQDLQASITRQGMNITELLNRQSFIGSLGQVVEQQLSHVARHQQSVDRSLLAWQRDKQRLSAFEALAERQESIRMLKENRLEQKMMDEFAQNAGLKSEKL